jgi:hypothetical protein
MLLHFAVITLASGRTVLQAEAPVRVAAGLSRRAVLAVALAAAVPARADDNPNTVQAFDQSLICSKRTPLGGCLEVGRAAKPSVENKLALSADAAPDTGVPAEESQLIQNLLRRTAENREKNEQYVQDITVKNGLGAQYGPFANTVPVRREDGVFDSISFKRYDKLKDKGKIVKNAVGLDEYVKGFDPDAPLPREKFLGIF